MKLRMIFFATALCLFSVSAVSHAADTTPTETKAKREYFIFRKNMETKLQKLDAEIVRLEAKTTETKSDVKVEADQKLQELKGLRSEISGELNEMSETTRDKYAKLKSAIHSKYEELSAKAKEIRKIVSK